MASGARSIAFINEKGGSAKTTLVANIAAYLASKRGHRVLAIDLDPQGQLGKVLGIDVRETARSSAELLVESVLGGNADAREDASTYATPDAEVLPRIPSRIPGLDLIIANKTLALHSGWAREESDPTGRLKRRLARGRAGSRYDFILMDAPPSFGPLTLNILRACREVVIPVPLTYLALDGCAELLRTLELVRTRYEHPDLNVTLVVPTFFRRTRLAHEILDRLRDRFPKELAHTVLGFHVKIDEAQSRGLSIFEHAPRDRGARALAAVAEELEVRGPPESAP